jgi:ribosomal protein L11 methyltransferase
VSSQSYLLKIPAKSALFKQLMFDVCDFSLVQKEDQGFVYSATLEPLKDLVKDLKAGEYEIESLNEDGWRDQWTENLEPIDISSLNLKIIPHTAETESTKRYSGNEIGLFPGRSFGIGHHETTKIMLELFGRHLKVIQGANILDFGCGSGILGIIASRLGASTVLSIDVDDEALRVTNINALLNQVKNLESSKSLHGQFNLLVINNLPSVIEKEFPKIKKYLSPSAEIFASGFLKDQVPSVLKLLRVEATDVLEAEEWAGFYAVREPHPAARLLKNGGRRK